MDLPESTILIAYIATGPVLWGMFLWLSQLGYRRMRLLRDRYEVQGDPVISVLVPAKDEADRIAECIRSIQGQDYRNLQIIAIDDRSADQTGDVLHQLAQNDPRMRVLQIKPDELPEGWTGKCNALNRGAQLASGQYILFVDSDVQLRPQAIRQTVGYMQKRNVAMFSAMPKLESGGPFERLVVPLAAVALTTQLVVPLTNHDHHRRVAFANGQYLAFRRDVYEQIGGHSAVRDRYCEDVHFAHIVKNGGAKVRVAWAKHLIATRMYRSLPQIVRGWARIFYATTFGFPWQLLLGAFFLLFCSLSAYPALAWGIARFAGGDQHAWNWLAASGTHLAIMSFLLGVMYTWSGNAPWGALALPVSGPLLLWIYLRALIMCATGKVNWRGTSYRGMSQKPDPARVRDLSATRRQPAPGTTGADPK